MDGNLKGIDLISCEPKVWGQDRTSDVIVGEDNACSINFLLESSTVERKFHFPSNAKRSLSEDIFIERIIATVFSVTLVEASTNSNLGRGTGRLRERGYVRLF